MLLCVSVYCNFDSKSLCGFTQDNSEDFDWTLNKGPTSSTPSTGPTADFSGNGNIKRITWLKPPTETLLQARHAVFPLRDEPQKRLIKKLTWPAFITQFIYLL